jgi:hypothetical protein
MLYTIGLLVTWMIILLVAWHDHEKDSPRPLGMDDIWDIILIAGCVGGILSAMWPFTWGVAIMLFLTHWIYKGYQNWITPNLEG